MKGQHTILGEMFLFAIGIIVVSYIVMVFGTLDENLSKESMEKKLYHIGNRIKLGITKLFPLNRGSILVDIPKKINRKDYYFFLKENKLLIKIVGEPTNKTIPISNIFNTEMVNNRITGASEYVTIRKDGETITLERSQW